MHSEVPTPQRRIPRWPRWVCRRRNRPQASQRYRTPRSQQHGPQQTKGCGKTQTAVAGCLCSLEGQVPTVEQFSLKKEETWPSPEDTTPYDTGRSPEEKPCVIPLWVSPEESDHSDGK